MLLLVRAVIKESAEIGAGCQGVFPFYLIADTDYTRLAVGLVEYGGPSASAVVFPSADIARGKYNEFGSHRKLLLVERVLLAVYCLLPLASEGDRNCKLLRGL